MNSDEWIVLQQGIRTSALAGDGPLGQHEWVSRSGHEAKEKGCYTQHDGGSPPNDGVTALVAIAPQHREDEQHQNGPPKQDGTSQGGPHAGDRVDQRGDGRIIRCYVSNRKVMSDKCPLHGHH